MEDEKERKLFLSVVDLRQFKIFFNGGQLKWEEKLSLEVAKGYQKAFWANTVDLKDTSKPF